MKLIVAAHLHINLRHSYGATVASTWTLISESEYNEKLTAFICRVKQLAEPQPFNN